MTGTPVQSTDHARRRATAALLLVAASVLAIALLPGSADAKTKWLCKPGAKPNPCKGSLETTRRQTEHDRLEAGKRPQAEVRLLLRLPDRQRAADAERRQAHRPPADVRSPSTRRPASREHCRVYAPVYRQATLPAIGGAATSTRPLRDRLRRRLEAWQTYLRNYNHGRGVVLIGHSQGTGMLSTLLAARSSRAGTAQALISAILLGGNVDRHEGQARRRRLQEHASVPDR